MKWIVASLLGLVAFFSGCTTVPETGRKQLSLVPNDQIEQMAISQFQQLKQQSNVSQDPEMNAQLQRVGRRIARQAEQYMPNTQWEFVVIDEDVVNAFAMPGGKVAFYTGIFPLFESDDDVAIVMGHEISHVIARHGAERVSQQLAVAGIGVGLGIALNDEDEGTKRAVLAAYGMGTTIGYLLPYSRGHESEADKIGLKLAARAGYDPRRAIPFWEKMASEGGARPPAFLSTHPTPETRIQRLSELMPEAMAEYNAATSNNSGDLTIDVPPATIRRPDYDTSSDQQGYQIRRQGEIQTTTGQQDNNYGVQDKSAYGQ